MANNPAAIKYFRKAADYIFLVLLSVFFLFPFFVILTRSLMSDADVMTLPAKIFPTAVSFTAYGRVFTAEMWGWLVNTLIIMVLSMAAAPLSASLCAFGFSKIKFRGRNIWFSAVLATMMLPGIVIQIPSYLMFNRLNLIDTPVPLILPYFLGAGAVSIFLFRQFMRTVPDVFSEAARIDGAGTFYIYWKIVLPLCKPIIVFMLISTFLSVWSDFMGPLIYLKRSASYTLALGIYYRFQGEVSQTTRANVQMATAVVTVLPCAIIFLIFQKQIMEGVKVGGIKG